MSPTMGRCSLRAPHLVPLLVLIHEYSSRRSSLLCCGSVRFLLLGSLSGVHPLGARCSCVTILSPLFLTPVHLVPYSFSGSHIPRAHYYDNHSRTLERTEPFEAGPVFAV